jgi:hypothetical protein
MKLSFKISILLFAALLIACGNPFAPAKTDGITGETILGDQTTVEGVFANFKYAYVFKDTLVYGNLLHEDFNFVFRDYEEGIDKTWGRAEDMITTHKMFNGTNNLDLIWNDIVSSYGDSLVKDISRSFNLTIVRTNSDVFNVYGRVNFRLKRESPEKDWKIINWRDESNY